MVLARGPRPASLVDVTGRRPRHSQHHRTRRGDLVYSRRSALMRARRGGSEVCRYMGGDELKWISREPAHLPINRNVHVGTMHLSQRISSITGPVAVLAAIALVVVGLRCLLAPTREYRTWYSEAALALDSTWQIWSSKDKPKLESLPSYVHSHGDSTSFRILNSHAEMGTSFREVLTRIDDVWIVSAAWNTTESGDHLLAVVPRTPAGMYWAIDTAGKIQELRDGDLRRVFRLPISD